MPHDPTPTPLTEAELNRLADLEAKATAAPWTTDSGSVPLGDTGDYEPYWFVNGNRKTNSQVASLAYCADEGDECDANMDLIASLRNAAPALLAAARENAGLRESLHISGEVLVNYTDQINALTTECDAALARVAELDRALQMISSKYHSDRSCSLEAQGYDQLDCAVIAAEDHLAQIALSVLNRTPKETPQ